MLSCCATKNSAINDRIICAEFCSQPQLRLNYPRPAQALIGVKNYKTAVKSEQSVRWAAQICEGAKCSAPHNTTLCCRLTGMSSALTRFQYLGRNKETVVGMTAGPACCGMAAGCADDTAVSVRPRPPPPPTIIFQFGKSCGQTRLRRPRLRTQIQPG